MANILMPDCLVKLNNLLQAIENAPVECDGHTLMISSALNHAGISHQRMCGVVKNPKTYFELYPHFWIEIGEFTLDYRLRIWVELYSGGKLSEGAPHGIFVFAFIGEEWECGSGYWVPEDDPVYPSLNTLPY